MNRKALAVALAGLSVATPACTATVTQASFFPDGQLRAPDAVLAVPAGYVATERMFDLPEIGRLRAVWLDNPGSQTTIIYSAGNGGFVDSEGTSAIAANLARLTGADIILYDYPGRGGTTVPATIEGAVASGPAMIAAFTGSGWMGSGPAYAYGFSFGGSMAAAMARSGGFAGLVIEGSAADYQGIGRDFVPGPLKPFVRIRTADNLRQFDYAGFVASAGAPVLLLSGARDRTIRPARMRAFADDLASRGTAVTFQTVATAHGGALATPEGAAALQAFVAGR